MTQTEWKITGNEWAASLLQKQIANGKIRHAYLFTGMRGVGRRTLALRFAQALNCPQPVAPGVPCGKCITCTQIERMEYTDLSTLKRLEEKTRIIIDQIRDLQHNLYLAPYQGKYRVGLCLNFEEANDAAQTAFLKTLEEAPEKVILLITADSTEALLPTIVSRCEVLRLHPMPVTDLEKALHKEWKFEPEVSRLLAHLSQGCVGNAITLHQNPELVENKNQHVHEVIDLLASPLWERFKFAEQHSGVRSVRRESEIFTIFQNWLLFWSDLLAVKSNSGNPIVNIQFEDEIKSIAGKLELNQIKRSLRSQQNVFRYIDQNANPRLLTEVLLLDWPRIKF